MSEARHRVLAKGVRSSTHERTKYGGRWSAGGRTRGIEGMRAYMGFLECSSRHSRHKLILDLNTLWIDKFKNSIVKVFFSYLISVNSLLQGLSLFCRNLAYYYLH